MNTKNIREIKIGYSCHKDWSKMSGSNAERHCESCSKSVFNFSDSSNEEILEFLAERNGQKNCGKFDRQQLELLNQSLSNSNETNFYKPLILGASLTTLVACGTSKKVCEINYNHEESNVEIVFNINNPDSLSTVLIKGQIFDYVNGPIIGANFVFDDSKFGCLTDLDGKFEIEVELDLLKSQTTSVHCLGYETLQIPLIDIKNKEVKISMVDMGVLLGEIVIIKQPLHKRIWNRFKNIFR